MMNFEEALQSHEDSVEGLSKSIAKYVLAVNNWKKACKLGNIGDISKWAASAEEIGKNLPGVTAATRATWNFDTREYLESGEWVDELQELVANKYGLKTIKDDGSLISSPVTLRAVNSRSVFMISKKNWPNIRPSVVAAHLKKLRDKTNTANSGDFLETLFKASMHMNGELDKFTRFIDVYDLFCLAPGYKKDNTPSAFGQQIYALHRSDLRRTRSSNAIQFEGPSGKSKEKDIFSVIADDGRTVRYYGYYFK